MGVQRAVLLSGPSVVRGDAVDDDKTRHRESAWDPVAATTLLCHVQARPAARVRPPSPIGSCSGPNTQMVKGRSYNVEDNEIKRPCALSVASTTR